MLVKRFLMFAVAIAMVATASLAQVPVFLTAGQSNADGREYTANLPAYMQNYTFNHLRWANVTSETAHASKDYEWGNRYAFCDIFDYWAEQNLQSKFYMIKCAYGGTAIAPGATYDHLPVWYAAEPWISENNAWRGDIETGKSLTKSLLEGFADLKAGELDNLAEGFDVKAIFWHQGESDRSKGGDYYENFKTMINYMRHSLAVQCGKPEYEKLPFIFGTVAKGSTQYSAAVETAQRQVAAELENVHVIDMSYAPLRSDNLHFDKDGTEYLGKQMYNKCIDLGIFTGEKLDVPVYSEPSVGGETVYEVERAWDFTKNWTDETATKLNADDAWNWNNGVGWRYGSTITTPSPLTCENGEYIIPETSGLFFQTSAGNRIAIRINANICFYADELICTIPKVRPGQIVTITSQGAKSDRGIQLHGTTADNVVVIEGFETTDGRVTNKLQVKTSCPAPVDIKFGSKNGATYVYDITVSNPPTEAVTIGSTGYTTFYYGSRSFVMPEGVDAYTYQTHDANSISGSKTYSAGDILPAGTPVLLHSNAAGTFPFAETCESGTAPDANLLIGSDEAQTLSSTGTLYFLGNTAAHGVGFYQEVADGHTLTAEAHKAYLELPATMNNVRAFLALDVDDATAITTTPATENREATYTLSGIRIGSIKTSGIYIFNGKKVIR